MDQITAMRIFMRVAELSSFTSAAEGLGLPKANVSAAVARLEGQLGTRLLHRTTRKVQLTQDGLAYFERCKDLLSELDEAQTMFVADSGNLTGRLRIDMSTGVARNIVIPALPEFLSRHPKLEVELSSTDRRVDVVREGFDCVLRVGTLTDSSLVARPLGHFRLINCASPNYLAKYGTPQHLADLAGHRLVNYVPILGGKPAGFEYVDAEGTSRFVAMPGALTVNNADAYQAACLAGFGLVQVPEIGVREHLAGNRLKEVLPHFQAAPMPVSLIYPHRRQLPRRVQVFMTWISEIMKPHLSC